MQYVRYSLVLVLIVCLFAAPIWPIKVETRGHSRETRADGVSVITGSFSFRRTCLVPFPYSDYGWIRDMPPGWLIHRSPFHAEEREGNCPDGL